MRRQRRPDGIRQADGRASTRVLREALRLPNTASGLVVKAIGSLPFAGRSAVRPSIYACHDARTRRARVSAYKSHLAMTAKMHVGHGLQAYLAARTYKVHASSFRRRPTLGSGTAAVVSGLYFLANTAVVYTQTDIAVRLGADQVRRWNETPESAPPPKERPPTPEEQVGRDVAVTLIGHAAFTVSLLTALPQLRNSARRAGRGK